MSRRDVRWYLSDMLEAIERVGRYTPAFRSSSSRPAI